MDFQVAAVDERIWPHTCHQLILADKLTRAFDQRDQQIEGAAAETKRFVGFQQEPLRRKETEVAERYGMPGGGAILVRRGRLGTV